jgi:hypothetical protein
VGASLLAIGFAGQVVGAIINHQSCGVTVASYTVAALAIVTAPVAVRFVKHRRETRIFIEHMRHHRDAEHRRAQHEVYDQVLQLRGREGRIDDLYAAAVKELGPLWPDPPA